MFTEQICVIESVSLTPLFSVDQPACLVKMLLRRLKSIKSPTAKSVIVLIGDI